MSNASMRTPWYGATIKVVAKVVHEECIFVYVYRVLIRFQDYVIPKRPIHLTSSACLSRALRIVRAYSCSRRRMVSRDSR